MRVPAKLIHGGLPMPSYAHQGDAGLDLRSSITASIKPGERVAVPTGVSLEIPEGFVGLVAPRSGLALQHGVTILNSPGVIDSGYRGEVMVILANTDRTHPYTVKRGDRVAQLIVVPCGRLDLTAVEELDGTERGTTGLGDSGR